MTIKDIAELAGVSPATVSLVLNHKGGVSDKTRRRILSIVERFNYTPSQVARSLVQRRSRCIGMMVPNTFNYSVFPEIAWGVDQVVKKHGYSLSLISTHDDPAQEAREIESAKSRGLDGIITSSAVLSTPNIPRLVEEGFPVISLLRRVYGCPGLEYVVVDHFRGGYLAGEHLLRIGYERLGIISGPHNLTPGLERFQGALRAASDYGRPPAPDLIYEGPFAQEFGYQSAARMLGLPSDQRPDAIFACNDDIAIGVFEAVLDAGLEPGRDVGIMGFNNIKFTAIRRVELSTIGEASEEMGRLAALRLIKRIEEDATPDQPYRKVLTPELVVRASCGFQEKGYRVPARGGAPDPSPVPD